MIDTHCHIHDDDYTLAVQDVLARAEDVGVSRVICVGTDARSSQQAVDLAASRQDVFAAIGLHPHDAETKASDMDIIEQIGATSRLVAVGECGLDYYYDNAPRDMQKTLLIRHFKLAQQLELPMIFHIRGSKENPNDAFIDFWQLYDEHAADVPGVVHSYSGPAETLEEIKRRNLYVGLNGIVTFITDESQLNFLRSIPLEIVVVETDSPLLTPVPFRGTINEPKHIREIIRYLSQLWGISEKQIAAKTTSNAEQLFNLTA